MSANESNTRISAARIEFDCAHGDRLSIEAAVIEASPAPSQNTFLRVSAAYLLGAGCGDPDAPIDAATGFAATYRGMIGNEIATLVGARLQDQLAASRASLTERAFDAQPAPVQPV